LAVQVPVSLCSYGLTLYETEFEEFNVGPDQWAGTNGWIGTSPGFGVHGIDQDIVQGLGKTAYLGYNTPASNFVTVVHLVDYDPVSNATPTVEFETLMGIEDSTNGFRDTFFFTFYNRTGNPLASIRFDNTDLNYGIWRFDGTNQFDTGVEFIRSPQLHILYASIDFSNNTWSADLDAIPLFTGVQFNATGQALDLGFVAAEWQLSSSSPSEHGDNWMLVADWAIRVFPSQVDQESLPPIEGVTIEGGGPSMTWTGAVGFDYAVEYSDDLADWHADLPDSWFANIWSPTQLTFTATTNVSHRSYRLHRYLAP